MINANKMRWSLIQVYELHVLFKFTNFMMFKTVVFIQKQVVVKHN